MGRTRRGRPINGILLLDKPAGESSNRSLQTAKRLYVAAKAGHTGSLDPLATGVLPVCFGEATKFSQYLLDSDKIYRSTFALGVITASGDADGDVLETRDASKVTEQDVLRELTQFSGDIKQVPSMFSALKHQGQPLYKLARQGIEVERKERSVTVYDIRLEAFRSAEETGAQPEADVYVSCSKGTYIRSIAEDLGLALGCGAHVTVLRRVQAGPFPEQQTVTLEALQAMKEQDSVEEMDALLLPVDSALGHLPIAVLSAEVETFLLHGHSVFVSGQQLPLGGLIRLKNEGGDFLGIGEMLDDGRIGPRRLIATN